MQPADPKVIARSYFQDLINKHNLSFADQLFDSAIALYDSAIIPGGQAQGLNAVKQFFTTFFTAFPDVQFEINDIIAEGERVAIRFTWTGTHRAMFLGITITDRHVVVPGIDIFQIANGKIAEVRVAFDRLELIEQLGGITHPL